VRGHAHGRCDRSQSGLGRILSCGRRPGLHLSTLVQDILRRNFPEVYAREQEDANASNARRFDLGFRWEDQLRPSWPAWVTPQYEVEKDGVFGTLDGLDLRRWLVMESKLSWRTSRDADILGGRYWGWIIQGCGYGEMVDADGAVYDILHVNGDYDRSKPYPEPHYRRVEVRWRRQERRENWEMFLNHRDTMERERRGRKRGRRR
jgi:hypothetical protein